MATILPILIIKVHKTYAQTVKWNDVVNEQGVEALAAKKNININGNVKVPTANSDLLHMTGNQFAKAYIGTELKDQSKALQDYQKAEQEFKNDPMLKCISNRAYR
jgi:predicted outer membrane protein